jgi:hypothetical protein
VEFPVKVKGLFRPHYMSWSEQQRIEFQAPEYLRNIIRIITESGLRVYKELMAMKKEQVDLENAVVWIPDSKTPNGIAEVPLTSLAVEDVSRSDSDFRQGRLVVPKRRKPDWSSEDAEDGLAVPIANLELHENMEFACPPSILRWRSAHFKCWPPPPRRSSNPEPHSISRTSRYGTNSASCGAR